MPAINRSRNSTKPLVPMNIILLGDPAAGKATQAQLLLKKYKLFDLDMGKELNKLRAKSSSVDKVLNGSTDKGNLTPTKIVRNIFTELIAQVPSNQGILFDGTPKMLGEAKLVAKLLKQYHRPESIFIYLHIPANETVKRMQGRKGYYTGKFGKRADDTVLALKNRVRYYRVNVSAVVAFFKSQFPYQKVSGMGSVTDVHKQIVRAIDSLIAK